MKRFSISLNVVLAALLLIMIAGQPSSAGGGQKLLNIPAATMVERTASEHSDGNSTVLDACEVPTTNKTAIDGDENNGDLNNGSGAYLAPVNLPDGVTINSFSLFTNDFDAEDAHAFLIRKPYSNGFTPAQAGYEVMAEIASNGAVADTIRKFKDNTLSSPLINNKTAYYFVEVVPCGFVEPYVIQIAYEKP